LVYCHEVRNISESEQLIAVYRIVVDILETQLVVFFLYTAMIGSNCLHFVAVSMILICTEYHLLYTDINVASGCDMI